MSKRKYKQRFSAREILIVEMIRLRKESNFSSLSMDDLEFVLGAKGLLPEKHSRNSLMMTMNGLCRKLNASGIYIQKSRTLGRGNKSIWYLNKEAAFNAAQKR